ncbi:hypothetical protein SS50377_27640 [Spironucleus salmonicida]|uniref:Uncharacterized protein n=1 Tax=Spironucleus salmonicida TaxID=348837 RepID=V6LPH6_9EUKA|nr:hypothetical protein SS50377_27640 [Spironucleus salmonicida]|eukprot:EST46582.1 Hypothetical protein SS50377_13386 [Spironucleus salmonicida]
MENILIEKKILSKLMHENQNYQKIIKKLYLQIEDLKIEHETTIIPQHDFQFEIVTLTEENQRLSKLATELSIQLQNDHSQYSQISSFQHNTICATQQLHAKYGAEITMLNQQIRNLHTTLNAIQNAPAQSDFELPKFEISTFFPQISYALENLLTAQSFHQQRHTQMLLLIAEKISPKLLKITKILDDFDPKSVQILREQVSQLNAKNTDLSNKVKELTPLETFQNDLELASFRHGQELEKVKNQLDLTRKKRVQQAEIIGKMKQLVSKTQRENCELTSILNEKNEELENVKTVFSVLQNELQSKIKQLDGGRELEFSEQASVLSSVEKLLGRRLKK